MRLLIFALTVVSTLSACVVIRNHHTLPHEEQVGRAKRGPRCVFLLTPITNDCNSYLGQEVFASAPPAARLTAWSDDDRWDMRHSVVVRRPDSSVIRIVAVNDARRTNLRELGKRGAIVAKIIADPEGIEDGLYPIGGRYTKGRGFSNAFYIAVDTFGILDPKQQHTPFARVHIYGVQNGKPVRMPGRGMYHWCRHTSDSASTDLALFASCEAREALARAERRYGMETVRNVLNDTGAPLAPFAPDDQRMLISLRTRRNDPASLPCGVGCCYASYDLTVVASPDAAVRGVNEEDEGWSLFALPTGLRRSGSR